MALSTLKNTYNRQYRKDCEFPIICRTCLGYDYHIIDMARKPKGKVCKQCQHYYTHFRWTSGTNLPIKETEICQTCSVYKNICQSCLLDLAYCIKVQVQNHNSQMSKSKLTQPSNLALKSRIAPDRLQRLAETAPYHKHNRPHVCPFWVKGKCQRGEECPHRHEKPNNPDDTIAARYSDERVILKEYTICHLQIMDQNTTLYLKHIPHDILEEQIRGYFCQYGEICSLAWLPLMYSAILRYTTSAAAENAAEKSINIPIIDEKLIFIKQNFISLTSNTSDEKTKEEQKKPQPALEPVPSTSQPLPAFHVAFPLQTRRTPKH